MKPINFRDAATHIPAFRPNVLFRTSFYFSPGENISTIVDLRRRGAEMEEFHLTNAPRRHHIPFVGSLTGLKILAGLPLAKLGEFMCTMGSETAVASHYFSSNAELLHMYEIMTENAGEELRKILYIVAADGAAEPNKGIAIHCVGGKDRTGIVIALLARLCGADLESIAYDYSLSHALLMADKDLPGNDPFLAHYREGMLVQSPKAVMLEFIPALERRHGSVRAFLLNKAKVSEDVLDKVVVKLSSTGQEVSLAKM